MVDAVVRGTWWLSRHTTQKSEPLCFLFLKDLAVGHTVGLVDLNSFQLDCWSQKNRKKGSLTMIQLLYATWFLLSVTAINGFVVPRTTTERLFASSFESSSSANRSTRATRNVPLQMVDGGLLQEAWTSYNIALEADPLLVKSLTACVILGAADLAGQTLEKALKENEGQDVSDDNSSIDIARTVRFAFFGLVLQAPWNHFYYQFLDGVLPPTEEPFTATTGIKVVIDQFVQAPIFTVLIFAFLGLLEGKSLASVKQQLDNDYKDTMLANCTCRCGWWCGPTAGVAMCYSLACDCRAMFCAFFEAGLNFL
jgi:hypothetical protein